MGQRLVLLASLAAGAEACNADNFACGDFATGGPNSGQTYFMFNLSNSSAMILPQRAMKGQPFESTREACANFTVQHNNPEAAACVTNETELMAWEAKVGGRPLAATGPSEPAEVSMIVRWECLGLTRGVCHATAREDFLRVCHQPPNTTVHQALTSNNVTFNVLCHHYNGVAEQCHSMRHLDIALVDAGAPNAMRYCEDSKLPNCPECETPLASTRAATQALRGSNER